MAVTTKLLKDILPIPVNNFRLKEAHALFDKVFGKLVVDNQNTPKAGSLAINSFNPDTRVCTAFIDNKKKRTIAIVGKGVLMDTGGYDIKTRDMHHMVHDKFGAINAVQLGINLLNLKNPRHNYLIITPFVENLITPTSVLPGSVIEYKSGKFTKKMMIVNTDAEGRVILADGLLEAQLRGADTIIDMATLTGAVSYALGKKTVGIMGNVSKLEYDLRDIFEDHGVDSEVLTLRKRHTQALYKSDKVNGKVLINIADSYGAGAQEGGAFLKEFIYKPGVRWIHLDVAGFVGLDIMEKPYTKLIKPLMTFIQTL